ncbi:hypothetical protein PLICRDRAFT_34328 [Plicaturopsis crispa FD-325 SS-3]|nr:hypothetical protein PLICRDRAFT_34328 [Plicaturopsis crispa FD-325 SS-3]
MAKGKKKAGPPYPEDPDYQFLVVGNPTWCWPKVGELNQRDERHWNTLATWLRFMFHVDGDDHDDDARVETIYYTGTRDTVIVQIPRSVNVEPFLGAHHWQKFLGHSWKGTSSIFQYNFRNMGDPVKRGWGDVYPDRGMPPKDLKFPVKLPYPPASWAEPSSALMNLGAKRLPSSRTRTPSPPPLPEPSQAVLSRDDEAHIPQEQSQSLFTPYERPGHLPPQPLAETSSPPVPVKLEPAIKEEEVALLVDKRDPYEEEDFARQLLHSESTLHLKQVDSHQRDAVKQEESTASALAYQPSDALIEALSTLRRPNLSETQQDVHVKKEPASEAPSQASEYTPSQDLMDAIAQLQASQSPQDANPSSATAHTHTRDVLVKREDSAPSNDTRLSRDPRVRNPIGPYKRIKEELDENRAVKRIKPEPE